IGIREAVGWTVVWVVVSMVFNVAVYFMYQYHLFGIGTHAGRVDLDGTQAAVKFFTGYIIEKSLSLDNIFVISMVFTFFGVPAIHQHRVLFWGILGALLMRGAVIGAGAAVLNFFEPMIYVFGGILIFTALKMLFAKHEEVHPEKNPLVNLAKRFFPVTNDFHGARFMVRLDGRLFLTPLFLVLLVVESMDVVFAVDSIPAIFAITRDPFLVFTSNIFAILGLRSLYFALAAMIRQFRYLKQSIVVILLYVGCKMMCTNLIETHELSNTMTWVSLGMILVVMAVGIIASLKAKNNE
ncbi:MAG: TerC/Alx family metal homeostasis membrane protein, partial [Planctomycetaceae bacterium]|nr:TerC/Alx family metal homeostasis membrane protein [Planctomycetaceae bacterium]